MYAYASLQPQRFSAFQTDGSFKLPKLRVIVLSPVYKTSFTLNNPSGTLTTLVKAPRLNLHNGTSHLELSAVSSRMTFWVGERLV